MTDSPSHWKRCKLGDVIRLKNGYAFKSQDYADEGMPLVRISDINDEKVSAESAVRIPKEKVNPSFYVEQGDLLIAMSGATTGKTGVYYGPAPVLQNQRVGNFKIIDEAVVDKKWRNYYVASLRKEIEKAAYGGAQPNISAKGIEGFDFPLPPPIEQKLIVAEIEKQFSRLDEAVANLKRIKANLKRYKAAVLKAAVEGKLTEDWRKAHPNVEPASKLLARILTDRRTNWKGKGKYKEPIMPDHPYFPSLPLTWNWGTVDQVANVQLGKMLDKQKHQSGKRLPYLRNINVRWGRIETEDLLEMFFEENQLDRYGLEPDDVLVCEGGEPGRASVWNGRAPGLKYQKALHRVRFHGETEPHYLVILLEFLANTGRLERWFTGSTIKHFTRESFISLPIPIPPIAEQKHIVAEVERRLSVIEELEATVEANLTRANRLRQSILQQAFSGKLIHRDRLQEPHGALVIPLAAESLSSYGAIS